MFPLLFSLGPIQLRTYAVFFLMGILAGLFVFWKRARIEYYEESEVFDVALSCMVWAIIGGRVSYIVLHFNEFGLNVLYWISLWSKPGFYWLGMYGAALWCFVKMSRNLKWNTFQALDIVAIAVAFANFCIHLGQFFAGGGRAAVTKMPWGIVFPGNFEARHPVSIYAALVWLLLFIFLWWVEDKYRRFVWYQRFKGDAKPGFLFFCFLIVHGWLGVILSFIQSTEYSVVGIDLSLVAYTLIGLSGVIGLVIRSGISTRLGLDSIKKRT